MQAQGGRDKSEKNIRTKCTGIIRRRTGLIRRQTGIIRTQIKPIRRRIKPVRQQMKPVGLVLIFFSFFSFFSTVCFLSAKTALKTAYSEMIC